MSCTSTTTFAELNLDEALLRALGEEGYDCPTPIQEQAITPLLAGRDLLGCAQTGTGKTAAFALPILQHLSREKSGGRRAIRALVITPTRELAAQIDESFKTYGRHLKLKSAVVFGGVSQFRQEKAINRGADILVATPGRLLDLMNQRIVKLDRITHFVLDEADRMLDMGFIHDIKRIIKVLPKKRQSLFFSATMPPLVADLARNLLNEPERISIKPQATTAEKVSQKVLFVESADKRKLLESMLIRDLTIDRALIFTRTKHRADRIAKQLSQCKIAADAIHGNKTQNARTRALEGFRSGSLRVLVATDIAARGIDVDGISHVINYELPNEPESYVHRIGRTARAGASGIAISFCSGDEHTYLKDIERTIRQRVEVEEEHPFHSEDAAQGMENGKTAVPAETARARNRSQGRQSSKGGGGGQSRSKNKSYGAGKGKSYGASGGKQGSRRRNGNGGGGKGGGQGRRRSTLAG